MPKDNFSQQAKLYAKFRPLYPKELYDFIYENVSAFGTAWDCATGNGQVARVLSQRFEKVLATDMSQKQLDHAEKHQNIEYSIGTAEQSGISEKVDLITVGQAIHWFDCSKFCKEAERISKRETILAYWGYGLLNVNGEIDPIVRNFHDVIIGPYWDPERKILDNRYKDINIPLINKKEKNFSYKTSFTLKEFAGYLNSWSSVQKYIRQHDKNPVGKLIEVLRSKWEPNQEIEFPIFLTLGCVNS